MYLSTSSQGEFVMSEVQNTNENRKSSSSHISIDVVVAMKGRAPVTFKTGSISGGSVFLLSNGLEMPKPGEEFSVTLPEFVSTKESVARRAVVRHSSDEGIAVEFLSMLD
jgi:hypothetical protein